MWGTIIGIASSVVVVLGGVGASMRWVIKNYLKELKPNSGASLNDVIKLQVLPSLQRLEANQETIKSDVSEIKTKNANLEGRFDQYVDDNKE